MEGLDGIWFRLGWKTKEIAKRNTPMIVVLVNLRSVGGDLLHLDIYVIDYAVHAIVCDLFD